MMTTACSICGFIITTQAVPLGAPPGFAIDPEQFKAVAKVAEFDLLAAKVMGHIQMAHEAVSREQAAVSFLAAKLYAMKWTKPGDAEFSRLRIAWFQGILEMFKTLCGPNQCAGVDAPAPAAGGSSSPPAGS